jgi:environmental stress-induced protein Ves
MKHKSDVKVFWHDKHSFQHQQWKNGKGSTLELLCLKESIHQNDFLFRLSIATMSANGPFSHFPDLDRHLLLISGE